MPSFAARCAAGSEVSPPGVSKEKIGLRLVPKTGTFCLLLPILISAMRIIAIRILWEFWESHADAEQPLKAWYKELAESDWSGPIDIKGRYPAADILHGNRVVFNIKGNTYRLIVRIHYNRKLVYIRFIGTHAEYDKVDAVTI